MKKLIYNPDINHLLKEYSNEKIISYTVVIAIFIGIGLGVKRYVQGPGQPVDGILVSGTATDVEKVKQEFKDDTKQSIDYKVKYVTTTKGVHYQKKIRNKMIQMKNLKSTLQNMQLLIVLPR